MNREKVFIIGGGPSLKGFDFDLLKNQNTIAVNYAVKYVPNPTYFLTADSGVIRKAVDANFWGMTNTIKVIVMNPKEHPCWYRVEFLVHRYDVWIKPYQTNTGLIGFDYEHFVTGKNTGFCALQHAVLLKYKKIYLLGFDLSRDEKNRKYFYAERGGTKSPYNVFLKHFITGINRIHNQSRIEVSICSKPSRLEPYVKFVPIEEALQ